MKKWWWSLRISLVTMMLLKTKGIIWSYIGLVWPYWKSLELNYFTNIYLNEYISIVLLSLLEKRIVNRSFSFRNPKESWISPFVMIVEISTEHRALNHIPFIYLIFLVKTLKLRAFLKDVQGNKAGPLWPCIGWANLPRVLPCERLAGFSQPHSQSRREGR